MPEAPVPCAGAFRPRLPGQPAVPARGRGRQMGRANENAAPEGRRWGDRRSRAPVQSRMPRLANSSRKRATMSRVTAWLHCWERLKVSSMMEGMVRTSFWPSGD